MPGVCGIGGNHEHEQSIPTAFGGTISNGKGAVNTDAWIEIHTRLKEHPKTYKLMDALHISKAAAVGHMVCLWLWAIDNAEDGDLTPFPPQAIAGAAEWTKKAQTFLDALKKCGWVDDDGARSVLHDWGDYAGRLIDKRKQSRDRAQKSRKNARNVRAPSAQHERDESALCAPTVPKPYLNHTYSQDNKQQQPYTGEAPEPHPPQPLHPDLGKVLNHWQDVFKAFPSDVLREKIKGFLRAGMSADVLSSAMDETALASPQSPQRYAVAILQSWCSAGVRDAESLKARKDQEQAAKAKPKGGYVPKSEVAPTYDIGEYTDLSMQRILKGSESG